MRRTNPKIALNQVRKPASEGTFNVTFTIGPNESDLPAEDKPIASRYVDRSPTIVDVWKEALPQEASDARQWEWPRHVDLFFFFRL